MFKKFLCFVSLASLLAIPLLADHSLSFVDYMDFRFDEPVAATSPEVSFPGISGMYYDPAKKELNFLSDQSGFTDPTHLYGASGLFAKSDLINDVLLYKLPESNYKPSGLIYSHPLEYKPTSFTLMYGDMLAYMKNQLPLPLRQKIYDAWQALTVENIVWAGQFSADVFVEALKQSESPEVKEMIFYPYVYIPRKASELPGLAWESLSEVQRNAIEKQYNTALENAGYAADYAADKAYSVGQSVANKEFAKLSLDSFTRFRSEFAETGGDFLEYGSDSLNQAAAIVLPPLTSATESTKQEVSRLWAENGGVEFQQFVSDEYNKLNSRKENLNLLKKHKNDLVDYLSTVKTNDFITALQELELGGYKVPVLTYFRSLSRFMSLNPFSAFFESFVNDYVEGYSAERYKLFGGDDLESFTVRDSSGELRQGTIATPVRVPVPNNYFAYYWNGNIDPEGVTRLDDGNLLMISEQNKTVLGLTSIGTDYLDNITPKVIYYDTQRNETSLFKLSSAYDTPKRFDKYEGTDFWGYDTQGVVANRGIESIAYLHDFNAKVNAPNNEVVFAVLNENPLMQDTDAAFFKNNRASKYPTRYCRFSIFKKDFAGTVNNRALSKIEYDYGYTDFVSSAFYEIDSAETIQEYVDKDLQRRYQSEQPAFGESTKISAGVSDMLYLGSGEFLILERHFITKLDVKDSGQKKNITVCRIYKINYDEPNVSKFNDDKSDMLSSGVKTFTKELLFDFTNFDLNGSPTIVDSYNLEALALGPEAPQGGRYLYVVNDNNAELKNETVLFRLLLKN